MAEAKITRAINDRLIEIHRRLLAQDPTATAEFAEVALEPLKQILLSIFRGLRDPAFLNDAANDAAVEAYMEYVEAPERYDQRKSTLFSFLKLAARRNFLNLLRKKRQFANAIPLDEKHVETAPGGGNSVLRVPKHDRMESQLVSKIDTEAKVRRIFKVVKDPRDRAVLRLLMDGERSTSVFAAALGIARSSKVEKEALVKRCKDRLLHHIKRSEGKRGAK